MTFALSNAVAACEKNVPSRTRDFRLIALDVTICALFAAVIVQA